MEAVATAIPSVGAELIDGMNKANAGNQQNYENRKAPIASSAGEKRSFSGKSEEEMEGGEVWSKNNSAGDGPSLHPSPSPLSTASKPFQPMDANSNWKLAIERDNLHEEQFKGCEDDDDIERITAATENIRQLTLAAASLFGYYV